MSFLDAAWVPAAAVAVGAFVLTYAGFRAWQKVRKSDRAPKAPKAGPIARVAPVVERAPQAVPRMALASDVISFDDNVSVTPAAAPASTLVAAAPRQTAVLEVPAEYPVQAPSGITPESWFALVREVVASEGILAEQATRLSQRRSLQSLLGNVRDRELLYAKGHKIGKAIYAAGYNDFGERLTTNHVCEEAQFRKTAGEGLEIRLIGTAMGKEAPVIGACVCFLEAGLIAGALENLEQATFHVREVRCVVKGDPVCEFRAESVAKEADARSWADDPSGLIQNTPNGGVDA